MNIKARSENSGLLIKNH